MRLKVILSVSPSSNPELYAELLKIPARSRAERIRSLATVGIASSIRVSDVHLSETHYKNNVPETCKPKPQADKELTNLSSQDKSSQIGHEIDEDQKERKKIASRIIKQLSKSL